MSLEEIASCLGGKVVGDPGVKIYQVGSLERAEKGQIAFLSNSRYKSKLASTCASAIVLAEESAGYTSLPCIVADDPYVYFARLSTLLNPVRRLAAGRHVTAIDASAEIAPCASIGAGATIAANVRIGERSTVGPGCHLGEGVQIGADCVLHAGVTVYSGCRIGARAILHSGSVIGADGFGFANDKGQWLKIPQIGAVVLGDDVEIGANTTVDRGAIDDTVIEDGVKLDNQIQIGHNCRIGAHTAMAGCVAVAGSARIGKYCTIGAGAIILGHLHIADHVEVSAATVITRSIQASGTYSGFFPFDDNRSWTRNAVLVRHLSEYVERIRQLESRLSELEKKNV